MRFGPKNIYFNEEERWASRVPEYMPIVDAHGAFSHVLDTRDQCEDRLIDLLVDDVDVMSAAQERSLVNAHIYQLQRINSLAQGLVPIVMLQIISGIENGSHKLQAMAEEETR